MTDLSGTPGKVCTDFRGQIVAGRYDVRTHLGSGNMGHVFRAWDRRLETEVVIKVPTLARLESEDFRRRFLQESRFLVKLNHPRIVTILDVGEHNGVPYFAMQFVGGGSLENRIHPSRKEAIPQPLSFLKCWVPGTAEALDFMHGKGYIHRDIKPGNFLFDEHGNAYLSDFGLSKLVATDAEGDSSMTAAGAVVGTPNYVAPEVVLGRNYDGLADQYSFAMTIYESLTGKCALEGPTPSATMVNQTAKKPRPPHEINPAIPPEVSEVLLRALQKSPKDRFPDCISLSDALLEATGLATGSGARSGIVAPAMQASPLAKSRSGNSSSGRSTKQSHPPLPQRNRSGISSSQSASQLPPSSRSSATSSADGTAILASPAYRVQGKTSIKGGRASCPKCQAMMKIKENYAGQKGRCNKCSALILIAKDLKTVSYVKLVKGAGVTSEQFSLTIGTALFGLRLKRWQALTLLTVLTIAIATSLIAVAYYSTRKTEADTKPVIKVHESQPG